MRLARSRYGWVCAALIVALALIVGLNDLGHFNTDIKPEVYLAPWAMVRQYLSSWTSTPYLGSANFNVGLVPVLLVLSALRGLGLSPEWTFKVFHFALWFIAAYGANRLARSLTRDKNQWIVLAAGVFYLANPYAIAAGNTLAIALPMAFLPWMLLCYYRALQYGKGWGWPAAFGLTFFAMSGMNVAVVPLLQMLAIIPIALVARRTEHRTWRQILAVTARCAVFVVGVSLYWLVPGVTALSLGTQVIDSSETLTGIHKVSSLTEVLRGLGLWPLYGHSDTGAWVPQNSIYVTSGWVIMLTALWPVLAAASMLLTRGAVRRVLATTFILAAVVMVGMFPGENHAESPFGWLLQGLFNLGPFAAFRTTNKIGAVLALACALALAWGCVAAWRWARVRPGAPPVMAGLAVLVVGAWILPALTNGLYISRMDIPDYWRQAAKYADQGRKDSATLLLPGQTRPSYRWSVQRPDDLTNSLIKREAIIPETTPNASAAGGNFLAALDDAVQEGVASGDVVSTLSRYLGADNILLRHDVVWETDGGARPAQTDQLMNSDSGLYGSGNFGKPGQNVLSPDNSPASQQEALLPPVQLYSVKDPLPAVRASSLKNQIIVAGDGWSFLQMQKAGLLRGTPTVRYAQDMTPAQLAQALAAGARLVVTDTNARRNVIPQRLTAGEGALLTADTPLKSTRTLGTSPADQTVLLRSGAMVEASAAGGTFFDVPYGIAENAFDGNPATSWRFGDFRRAPGQWLKVSFPSTQKLGKVSISQADLGPVKINEATLNAGGKSVTVRVPDSGKATFDMGGVSAKNATLTVKSIRGEGFNLVGVTELGLPGPKAMRAARTPQTLSTLVGGLDAAARQRAEVAGMDVLLTRVQNTSNPADDSEIALRRVVSLPVGRTFDASAAVRVDADSVEPTYDRSAGYDTSVTATSSGFWFSSPSDRASGAIDDSDQTGWTPGGTYAGGWWQVRGSERTVNSIKVTQRPSHSPVNKTQWAKHVTFYLDGKPIASSDLKPNGTTDVAVPNAPRGSTLRMVINTMTGPKDGAPGAFTAIDAGWQLRHTDPAAVDAPGKNHCLPVASVDGQPLMMRLKEKLVAGATDQGTDWESCAPTALGSGDHRIEQADGFILDSLALHADSPGASRGGVAGERPTFTVTKNSPTTKQLQLTQTDGPTAVTTGQSFDPRWEATLNGKSLGKPTTIDGFSTGWILPAGAAGEVTMRFAPQTSATVALAATLLVLGLSGLLVFFLWRRGQLREPLIHRTERVGREDRLAARASYSPASALAFVILATLALGVGGLLGGITLVALRHRRLAMERTVVIGAGLMLAAFAIFCLLNISLGTVNADAISANLWPHRIAAAGLVIAVGGLALSPKPRPRRLAGWPRNDDE